MIVDLKEKDWYLITKLLEFHSLKVPIWMGVELTALQRIIEAQLKNKIQEEFIEQDIISDCIQRPSNFQFAEIN